MCRAGESLDHETPLSGVVEDQISCADIVLMSWADLAGEGGLGAARKVIEAESPRVVPILPMSEAVIDTNVALVLNTAAEDNLAARPSPPAPAPWQKRSPVSSAPVPTTPTGPAG